MLTSQRIYETLVDEEDAPDRIDISEAAVRETPKNFVLILAAQSMTKLGDAIANPKTVLAWIMAGVGAPVALIGLLVPIRESGSLIPQLLIASWVRRCAVRKWIWVVGSIVQGSCVLAIGAAALMLEGVTAGWTIIALLAAFSLARAFCSIASKDVLGKTVPKQRRGRLTGWSASAAGLISILVGVLLMLPSLSDRGATLYGSLLFLAGGLWLVGATVFARIAELEGEADQKTEALAGMRRRMRLLLTDKPFRMFIVTRSLLLCSALSAPYYLLLARAELGDAAYLLGLFVIAAGVASLVASPVWGRLADQSSRRVMSTAALASGLIGVIVFIVVEFAPAVASHLAFFPVAYFVLSVAHGGVRVGRKTYVVDLADRNRRTDYVSVSNTVIGIILLIAGSAGALSSILSLSEIVLLLSAFGLLGAWLGMRLEETELADTAAGNS